MNYPVFALQKWENKRYLILYYLYILAFLSHSQILFHHLWNLILFLYLFPALIGTIGLLQNQLSIQ